MTPSELTQQMLARIDRQAMREAERAFTDVWAKKFFDVEEFTARAAEKALELKMDDPASKRRKLFDVGCGFGYLCLAADILGWDAVGLDIPHPCTAAVAVAVPFRLVSHRIRRFDPLPAGLENFDLITMFGVNLFERPDGQHPLDNLTVNEDLRLPPEGWWREPEYRALIDDLHKRLAPGGRIVIEFNRGRENDWLLGVRWNHPYQVTNHNRIQIFNE